MLEATTGCELRIFVVFVEFLETNSCPSRLAPSPNSRAPRRHFHSCQKCPESARYFKHAAFRDEPMEPPVSPGHYSHPLHPTAVISMHLMSFFRGSLNSRHIYALQQHIVLFWNICINSKYHVLCGTEFSAPTFFPLVLLRGLGSFLWVVGLSCPIAHTHIPADHHQAQLFAFPQTSKRGIWKLKGLLPMTSNYSGTWSQVTPQRCLSLLTS